MLASCSSQHLESNSGRVGKPLDSIKRQSALEGLDRKRCGAFALLPDLPHPEISGLDMTAIAVGVEQRCAQTILHQFLPQGLEPAWLRCQAERHVLVFIKAFHHELGQSYCA